MLKHQIKSAFRNLLSNKAFTTINIVGLAIGLSTSFVIGMLVYYDLTFDKHHKDSEQIYRITSNFKSPNGEFHNRGIPIPLIDEVKHNISGVEKSAPFFVSYFPKVQVNIDAEVFEHVEDAIYTDASYFELFDYKWIAGNKKSVLNAPNEVVLTEERAKRYFSDIPYDKIVGKILTYNDELKVKVVGIVKNIPQRTDFYFQEFVSRETAKNSSNSIQVYNDWWNGTNSATQLFVKLIPNTKLVTVQKQLDDIARLHQDKDMVKNNESRTFYLQPFSDLHFNTKYGVFDSTEHQASKSVLISLISVAVFLLLLACINFINLNTAQASKRLKEVGIRKTLGSSKKQLIVQFVLEAFILTLISGLISIVLSALLLKQFSDFIPQGIDFSIMKEPLFISSSIILVLVVSLLSGFYPSMVLSKFKPISVMKNQGVFINEKAGVRKYLTVFQFVIAQVFIIATLLVGKQINFLLTKDMGFATNTTAYISLRGIEKNEDRIRFFNTINKIPEFSKVSLAKRPPASSSMSSSRATYVKDGEEILTNVEFLYGDRNYLNVYDIKLLAGRERLNDTINELIINETYSKLLGFNSPSEAIGKSLKFGNESRPIVGVMKDFYQRSLHTTVKPMALKGGSSKNGYPVFGSLHFSFDNLPKSQWKSSIDKIESIWKSIVPETSFEVHFLDDTIKRFYRQEAKTSALLKWATGLAILISCLGLLGLVIYTTERRVKEISIRKVLGASLSQLNFLLAKEFLLLVLIACVIAVPIAWYGLDYWLQGFAYKTSLSWWLFIVSSLAMCIIALFVVGLRIWQTSIKNPAETLRSE